MGDLPANILGCFILGFMSKTAKITVTVNIKNDNNDKVIPWIQSNHYFQNWHEVHLAIRTGFCGSLTTFASWNAQMVKMICTWDISEIILAFLGYMIGVQSTYMSLKFGQNVSFWIFSYWQRKENEKHVEDDDDDEVKEKYTTKEELDLNKLSSSQKEKLEKEYYLQTIKNKYDDQKSNLKQKERKEVVIIQQQ